MKNADIPAMPTWQFQQGRDGGGRHVLEGGLTKREQFCLRMGVPETGDAELDGIIRKGNRSKLAMVAMQGKCALSGSYHTPQDLAHDAVKVADALLAALEVQS